jgi:hypothetical protein
LRGFRVIVVAKGGPGRRAVSHLRNRSAEVIDLIPIRKIDYCLKIRRPFGHPHDESDDLAVPKIVYRIVYFSRKYRQFQWLPGYLL